MGAQTICPDHPGTSQGWLEWWQDRPCSKALWEEERGVGDEAGSEREEPAAKPPSRQRNGYNINPTAPPRQCLGGAVHILWFTLLQASCLLFPKPQSGMVQARPCVVKLAHFYLSLFSCPLPPSVVIIITCPLPPPQLRHLTCPHTPTPHTGHPVLSCHQIGPSSSPSW